MVETIFRVMRSRPWIAVLVAVIGGIYLSWILRYGLKWGTDVGTYSAWADGLIACRFNYAEYLQRIHFVVPPVLYLGWVTTVAVAKLIGGDQWQTVIVALNWLAMIGIASLLLTTVRRLTSSAIAVTVTAVLLVNFDILTFIGFPLSDILFLAIVSVILVLAIRIAEQRTPMAVIGGTASVLVACIFRPTAAPIVVVWLLALLWPSLSPKIRRWIVPALVLLIIVAVLLHAAIMQDVTRWPFDTGRSYVAYLENNYHNGVIICGRPDTFAAAPAGYADYVRMTFRRWASFFAIVVGDYSRFHKIANVLYLVPAYTLALAALLLRPATSQRKAATTLLAVMILAVSAFHGMQEVDFDHRYRLPIFPALIMLAGFGAAEIARRLRPISHFDAVEDHS